MRAVLAEIHGSPNQDPRCPGDLKREGEAGVGGDFRARIIAEEKR